MSTTYFISDLHLSPEREDITLCFENFMAGKAQHADALYVLGDLFEVWIGDDDRSVFSQRIIEQFAALSQRLPIYFIRGNRDFLVGRRFCRQAGITLLPEQQVINLYGTPTLLMHGDELCTQDESYQRFRKFIRHPLIKFVLKSIPLSYRRKLGVEVRRKSIEAQRGKMGIMDVVEADVVKQMQQHEVDVLIHGHTHRPNIHSISDINGRRVVLGDWYDQGSILEVTAESINLRSLKHQVDSDSLAG